MEKAEQIEFCLTKIKEILTYLRPTNIWNIIYANPEDIEISDWDKKYLALQNGEEYFFIYIGQRLLYAVNVTGDSVLTAIQELIDLLARKF